jgi:hypothetical protein
VERTRGYRLGRAAVFRPIFSDRWIEATEGVRRATLRLKLKESRWFVAELWQKQLEGSSARQPRSAQEAE